MKILVIQQKMIGDVLVSTIICDNLRKAYPNAQIDYMVYRSTVPVLQGNTNIDNLIIFEKKHRKSILQFLKLIYSIRRSKYDIIIDSYSKLESFLTVLLSSAKQKISYKKKGRKFLYTQTVPMLYKPKTKIGLTIERRLSLLRPLQLDIDFEVVPKLFITNSEKKVAKALFKSNNIDSSRKTIMVSVIGSTDNKTYPLNYMSKIVDFIADNVNANLLFNYMPNQLELAQTIYNQCKETTKKKIYFDVLGDNLRDFIAIMNQCDLIIGNDSGSINIAKALNKPSFIIFSPWIQKKMWATFEDGHKNNSVHLKDFKPKLFKKKTDKFLKENAISIYKKFKPDFIYEKLLKFLDYNVLNVSNKVINIDFNKIYNTNKKSPLSALIITYNEEDNIEKLIKNLNFADEILVVDSYSTDKTIEIINSYKHVKLIQNKFIDFSKQRNFALSKVKHNWVLFIDADEEITPKLKNEINSVLESNDDIIAYEMYRQFFFKNKLLNFSGWQTDKVFRFYNKNYVTYEPTKYVHETLNIKGKTTVLKNKLNHYSFINYTDYKNKMDHYAKLRAIELFEKKLKPNFYHFYLKPLYRFFNHFIIRFGFLDGKKGYIICCLSSYGVKQRYVELKKLYIQKK
jgi:ADP-heptose:LPS heptosyltransferase/glycosyltransferase involved in cell wall biosynthesis